MESPKICWNRIYAITLLNAAIVICWMVYSFFQPKLLGQFGLKEAAATLEFSESIIFVLVPVLAGLLADRLAGRLGKNYIVFTVGIGFTALIFMASAYVFLENSPLALKSAIPFFMILWLIGMNVFYSPAATFLLESADSKDMPLAVAMLSMTTNILFAVMGYILLELEVIGSSAVFIIGAFLLVGAALYYFRVAKNNPVIERQNEAPLKSNFFLPIWAGIGAGVLEILVRAVFLEKAQPMISGIDMTLILFLIAGILTYPLCFWLMRFGMGKAFHAALGLAVLLIGVFYCWPLSQLIWPLLVLFAVLCSTLGIVSFSYGLSKMKTENANLGGGLIIGAYSLPSSILYFMGLYGLI